MSNAEQLAATLNACERSGIWYRSSDAANELRRLQAEVERLTAENKDLDTEMSEQCRLLGISGSREARLIVENVELRKTLLRYVKEVPLGNQPPMLAEVAYKQAMKETP